MSHTGETLQEVIPLDVFYAILAFVNASTLEALNIATRFNTSFHDLVLREQWHTVVILMEWVDRLPRGFSHCSLQILRRALRACSFRGKPLHTAPASFIRKLEVLESHQIRYHDIMPGSELDLEPDVQQQLSLSSLLSSCSALQEIRFQGQLDQAGIEDIIHPAGRTIQTLTLRYPGSHCWGSQPDWSRLSLLPSLRTLMIGDFEDGDVDHLVKEMGF